MSSDSPLLESNSSSEKPLFDPFSLFVKQFEEELEPERKARLSIDFMRNSLAQFQSPQFKQFWQARRLCLPLFKEKLSPALRALLWAEYIEISAEARHLKEILDEQSAFAVEQIGLAIEALEQEMQAYEETLSYIPSIAFPEKCAVLRKHHLIYDELQRELNLLNRFASRINSMRKEIIKTEMRVRHKNAFFEKLSVAGDRVFPRRKELIAQISERFLWDVNRFISVHFEEKEGDTTPLFVLREDIKTLQAFAKCLTLNTQVFSETRLSLSACWDKVKELDKESKKEMSAKKEAFKQNQELVLQKIALLHEKCLGEISHEEDKQSVDEILSFMRTIELGREEVKALHAALQEARLPILQKQKEKELEREEQKKMAEQLKQEQLEQLKEQIERMIATKEPSYEQLAHAKADLLKKCEELSLSKRDRLILDKLFRQLKEQVEETRREALLNLSDEDKQAFQQLQTFLDETKEERQEVKNSLDACRKQLGASGFDFEKALEMQELLETEKSRLQQIDLSIEKIEAKLAAFQA